MSASQTPPEPNNHNRINRNRNSYIISCNNNNYCSHWHCNGKGNGKGNNSVWESSYVTAVVGVGLSVLGIVLILWEVVPACTGINGCHITVRKTAAVGYVLLALGMAMILLSIFICLRNKCGVQGQTNSSANMEQGHHGDRQPGEAEQYSVPSYVEAVGNAQYPISQFSPWQNSNVHLPTYKEVVGA